MGRETHGDEEVRSGGVEKYQLDGPLNLPERCLRMPPGYLVNPDATLAFAARWKISYVSDVPKERRTRTYKPSKGSRLYGARQFVLAGLKTKVN